MPFALWYMRNDLNPQRHCSVPASPLSLAAVLSQAAASLIADMHDHVVLYKRMWTSPQHAHLGPAPNAENSSFVLSTSHRNAC